MRLLLVTLLFSLTACVTTATWTPDQRRNLQQREFATDTTTLFNAIKSILRDDGYIIINQDLNGGLIVASKDISSAGFFNVFVSGENDVSGKAYKLSFDLEMITESRTRTRLTINEMVKYKGGGEQGSELLKPEVYNAIYRALTHEVAKRNAVN